MNFSSDLLADRGIDSRTTRMHMCDPFLLRRTRQQFIRSKRNNREEGSSDMAEATDEGLRELDRTP